jgi:uncharacterized membrane protein YeaQ/YmgE (transglycosylase-associated protein family)
MGVLSLIIFLVIGLVAGWLAGNIMKGRGFGLLGNLAVGVIGSFIGGLVFRLIGLGPTNIVGSLIAAVVGAVVLLYVVGLLKKASRRGRRGVRHRGTRPTASEGAMGLLRLWHQAGCCAQSSSLAMTGSSAGVRTAPTPSWLVTLSARVFSSVTRSPSTSASTFLASAGS